MGNAFINELIIGMGSKDRFSMDQPANDIQFASFFADPSLARVLNALTGGVLAIPGARALTCDRSCSMLRPLPPRARPWAPWPTCSASTRAWRRRLTPRPAVSACSGATTPGYPNGRRVFDDVTDISLRVVAGGVLAAPFPGFNPDIGGRLGDGVNVNDFLLESFLRGAFAERPRSPAHRPTTEPGCTAGAGAPCP